MALGLEPDQRQPNTLINAATICAPVTCRSARQLFESPARKQPSASKGHFRFAMSWAVVIGIFALLQGLGKFLDEHHVSSAGKERIRLMLIRVFFCVGAVHIPAIPSLVFRRSLIAGRRISRSDWLKHTAGFFAGFYLSILIYPPTRSSLPFLSSQFWRPGISDGLVTIAAFAAALLSAALVSTAMLFGPTRAVFRFLAERRSGLLRAFAPPSAVVAWLLCVLLVSKLLFNRVAGSLWLSLYQALNRFISVDSSPVAYVFMVGFMMALFLALLALMACVPVAVVLVLMAIFGFIKLSIGITRFALLSTFQAASDTNTSPFTYASALLGLLVLGLKILAEIF